jgi:hypothetical protein
MDDDDDDDDEKKLSRPPTVNQGHISAFRKKK